MQKITPFLWFDGRAEEAINFYTSVFNNSSITSLNRGPDGEVFIGSFQIEGQDFMALNGGPMFKFTAAISLFVNCESQEEVDRLWAALTDGGREDPCGWLEDKFGFAWQIIPKQLMDLMNDPDPEKSGRVHEAMFKMTKIIIADLEAAHQGE